MGQTMKTNSTVMKIAQTALFAALCYVIFTYLQIKIPMPGGDATSIHLGNAFCVLAALLLGGWYGGLAGAIGMGIADVMDPIYITGAPKTFILKLCIGLITGLVAHKIAKINESTDKKYIFKWSLLASVAGLAFNDRRILLQTVHSGTAAADGRGSCKMERSCYLCKCSPFYNRCSDHLQCTATGTCKERNAGSGEDKRSVK